MTGTGTTAVFKERGTAVTTYNKILSTKFPKDQPPLISFTDDMGNRYTINMLHNYIAFLTTPEQQAESETVLKTAKEAAAKGVKIGF